MTENKYGNLLDIFMHGNDLNDYNSMRSKKKQKYVGETENRYGDLLKNAKPDMKCLNTMVNFENDRNRRRAKEAEEQKLYSDIDKLMQRNPKLADAYVDVVTKVKG